MHKVLVVDDEILICGNLTKILAIKGYTAFEAHNGMEALEFLDGHDVDVVLLDMMMPVMNGMEALKKIKQGHPGTAVIMITAVSDRAAVDECITAGAFSFIDKPVSIQNLLTQIECALQSRGAANG